MGEACYSYAIRLIAKFLLNCLICSIEPPSDIVQSPRLPLSLQTNGIQNGHTFELPHYSGELSSEGTQLRPESKRKSIKAKRDHRRALYLDEGQAHTVWKPKRVSRKVHVAVEISTAMLEMEKQRQDLHERQQKLMSRVQATREVLKVQREELANFDEDEMEGDEWLIAGQAGAGRRAAVDRRKWRSVITRVKEEDTGDVKHREKRNRKKLSLYFHNRVSRYVVAMAKPSPYSETGGVPSHTMTKRAPSYHSLKMAPLRTGLMPLRQWRSLMFEDHHRIVENEDERNQTQQNHCTTYTCEDSEPLSPNCNGTTLSYQTKCPAASESNLTEEPRPSISKQLSLGPNIP